MSTLTDNIEIKINGKEYEEYNFLNIVLTQELLKPNELRFTMQKKDFFKAESDVNFSMPKELVGATVSLMIKTIRFNEIAGQANEVLEFEGIIFNVDVSRKSMVSEILIDLVAYSPDYLLMDHKHCTSYRDQDLKTLIEETIKPYEFEKTIDPMFTTPIPYSVQYNETNYEYMTRLAQRYGEWLYYDGKKFVFGKIQKLDTLTLYSRTDILDYRYSSNLKHTNYLNRVYNYKEFELREGNVEESVKGFLEFSDTLEDKSKELFTKPTLQHLRCARLEDNEAKETITAIEAQWGGETAEMITCSGRSVRADLRLGSSFKIKDLYNKNNKHGYYDRDELLVTKIIHRTDGGYENEFTAVSAKSKFPPYHNSDIFPVSVNQIAMVIDNKDPDKLGRVRVTFLWEQMEGDPEKFDADNVKYSPWLQIANPYGGGNAKGFYFVPERGYFVMVGFEMGNMEKPYVIGTIRDAKYKLPDPKWIDEDNKIKVIRTRHHTIEIKDNGYKDEESKGYVTIYDINHKYDVTMSADDKSIKMKALGNITLEAGNSIILKAGNDIKLTAKDEIQETCDGNYVMKVGGSKECVVEELDQLNAKNIVQYAEEHIYTEGEKEIALITEKLELHGDKLNVESLETKISANTGVNVESKTGVNIDANTEINIKAKVKMGIEAAIVNIN